METIQQQGLRVTVQSIDGDRAVLLLPDGQIVRWPLAQLPAGTKSGDTIGLQAGITDTREQVAQPTSKTELAHAVLNEIFAQKE